MFSKILIANRGEIACRVMKTAHSMGIRTVAVYSDADAQALHVTSADEAIHIGASSPTESYLNGDTIIAAALKTGTQAIHPGYGFLSENPDFVEAVQTAGLIFIGPSAASIRAMGLKDAAKTLMQKAGVPVVPGYHGSNQNDAHLAKEAENIGYPVLIKAVAGGGGKGMRQVNRSADFADALAAARAESLSSFANDAVLIEKYIEKPRHIEVQIFGDGKDVVHLYERDCSLQRRHQKVIEEAPAPGMTQDMRAAMCKAAITAAQATNYSGAGTVEFIVDASGDLHPDRFWFMEMNTRLQVEHPVTEAVTGVDLVEWQLRVAAGEPLPKNQDQLSLNGHAFEARIYAEDAENGFLPAIGTLTHLKFPNDARADTGVRSGDTISQYYDPMIAKLITHADTREIALLQLSTALAATEVAGTVTNLTFLGNLSRHEKFSQGHVDTGLIARDIDGLTKPKSPTIQAKALAIITAAGIGTDQNEIRGFTLWRRLEQRIELLHRGDPVLALLSFQGRGRLIITIDDQACEFTNVTGHWTASGDTQKLRVLRIGNSVSVFGPTTWHFDIPDPLHVETSDTATGNTITAPMPGLIKALFVEPGQQVSAGDRLVILEAMKMEHVMTAPRDANIAEVLVHQDAQVAAGAPLITLDGDDQ